MSAIILLIYMRAVKRVAATLGEGVSDRLNTGLSFSTGSNGLKENLM